MSYKNIKAGTEEWWNQKIEDGKIKAKPQSGNCMFCGKDYKGKDSVCQNCWKVLLNR